MKGDAKILIKVLDGSDKKLFIPVYQRNYDWKKDNCELLFKDLIKLVKEPAKKSHFFGSIVTAHQYGGGGDSFVIIDGQQRITTISLLFLAMINAVNSGDAHAESSSICDKILKSYIIDEYSMDKTKVRLKPTRDDNEAFLKIVNNEKESLIEGSNVTNNYRVLYEAVKEMQYSIDQLFEAIKRLVIIDIFVEDDDDPQLIFESLNSTGLKLTTADMIRNYVLMGLESDKQSDFYNNYWVKIEKNTNKTNTANFFRDYLTVKQAKIPSIENVYNSFKVYADGKNIEDILKDLLKMSNIYRKIISANSYSDNVNDILFRLNILEMTVSYPYLMSLFDFYEDGNINEEELVVVLKTIETYVFRRLICSCPTNALNKIFCTLHGEAIKAKQSPNNSYSVSVIYVLQIKTRSSIFPGDKAFKDAFSTKDIYSMQKKNKLYLFDRLENQDSRETTDLIDKINSHTYTIEHIMPQTLNKDWKAELGVNYEITHQKWLNTIANLSLSGYNSNYQNKRFIDKKMVDNGYNDSPLRLNQYLKTCDKWTEEEMGKRCEMLLNLALKLWPYPSINYVAVKTDENEHGLNDEYDYKSSKLKKFILMGTVYSSNDWTDMIENVLKTLCDLDSEAMKNLAFDMHSKYLSSTDKKYGGRWVRITENIFLNVNTDTMTKIRILRDVFEEYDIDTSELRFVLHS